jgi:type VI secretion system secreted protein VgrG
VKLDLGKITEEALQSIELKVGQSSVKIDQTGVTIKGMMVKINGTVMTEVKGLMTKVEGNAMLKIGGAITMIG